MNHKCVQFNQQQGFTLVELAIVLVIISLLMGGILKAQAMIENVQIKKDIQALQAFQTAYMLYIDRHGSIPGEDKDKPGRLLTTLSTQQNPTEGFFFDLQQSGFIQSTNPLPNIGQAFKSTWGGSSGANYGLIAQKNQICITQVDVDLGQWVEQQMDNANNTDGDVEYTENGSQLCMLLR